MEELVAEIGAAFLCADLGITPETRPDHAAYIASWLKVLKDDKRAIFTAASHAGFLSPGPGNTFNFHAVSPNFPGVINTTPGTI
jgi:hypothetical protein